MTRSDIPFERLIAFAADELNPQDAMDVRNALANSPESAAVVERYRTIVGIAKSDRSVEPPTSVLADAMALFANRRVAAKAGLLDGLMRFVAELVHDSRRQVALAGVRGSAAAFQLSFQSELADVDLDVEPPLGEQTTCRIMGQVSPRQTGTRIVEVSFIRAGGEEPGEKRDEPVPEKRIAVHPDESGTFALEIEPGRYDVVVKTADAAVVMSDVVIL